MTDYQEKVGVSIGFVLSLPERTIRVLAALIGGLIYETFEVLLPSWLRRTRLYKAIIAQALRIVVELVGGVSGVIPADEVTAQELAMRKAAGTGIEFAGLLAMGWSPLWLFAVVTDLTGGTRTYLRTLVAELKRDGVLAADAEISSVEQLLDTLEDSSDLVAETLDIPPLNLEDLRGSWQELRQHTAELPDGEHLAKIYAEMQQVTEQEDCSLVDLSTLLATGALRAGIQVGQLHIFDYYQAALQTITKEGLRVYARRVTRPYLAAARLHLDPRYMTNTERFLLRRSQKIEPSVKDTSVE
jgi:hypothetical protein